MYKWCEVRSNKRFKVKPDENFVEPAENLCPGRTEASKRVQYMYLQIAFNLNNLIYSSDFFLSLKSLNVNINFWMFFFNYYHAEQCATTSRIGVKARSVKATVVGNFCVESIFFIRQTRQGPRLCQ
jgi:hypothetical protein